VLTPLAPRSWAQKLAPFTFPPLSSIVPVLRTDYDGQNGLLHYNGLGHPLCCRFARGTEKDLTAFMASLRVPGNSRLLFLPVSELLE